VASQFAFESFFLSVFWPLVGSLLVVSDAIFCMFKACVSLVKRMWRLLSDKLTELVTESESVAFVVFDFVAFERVVLHLVARVLVEADIADNLNVEIDPVDSKSS